MKVFISWSGDYSREVAEKLSEWIPGVIQSVGTFYSPNDIGKGENWSNRLSQELDECNFGIICLTSENVAAPWIHFEAGSLAKSMNSRLSSIMLGVSPSDIKGPLSRFQNTKFERADFFKLIQAINDSTERPLLPNTFKKIFDIMWPELEKEVKLISKKYENIPTKEDVQMSDHDAIQEILRIIREKSNDDSPIDIIYNDDPPSSEAVDITITNLGPNPTKVLQIIHPYVHISKETVDFVLSWHKPLYHTISGTKINETLDALRSAGALFTITRIHHAPEVTP